MPCPVRRHGSPTADGVRPVAPGTGKRAIQARSVLKAFGEVFFSRGDVFLSCGEVGEYDKRVALKLVKRGMDTDEILQRFHMERRILAALEHCADVRPEVARGVQRSLERHGTLDVGIDAVHCERGRRYQDAVTAGPAERADQEVDRLARLGCVQGETGRPVEVVD